MLEHLSCLEAESLSNHQCRAATQTIGLDAREVAVARHLNAIGLLTGDTNRAAFDNCLDFIPLREILQVDSALVERNLLLVALDLGARGDVGV